jgi:lysozyme
MNRRPRHFAVACALALATAACDRAPVPFSDDARCAIRGLDVSRHQGQIHWPTVFDAGARFAWIKATEGGDYLDPAFRRNWLLSRAAGVRRGAYHFVYWCRKAEDQAAWFIAHVPADPDALPPVLDVEWNPASRTCPQKIDRDQALGMMTTILAAMEKAYARKPIIYAPLDFYDEVMRGAFADYPLWVRNIDEPPAAGYDRTSWTIWQRQDDAVVDGIAAAVDIDCFHGGETLWRAWAQVTP